MGPIDPPVRTSHARSAALHLHHSANGIRTRVWALRGPRPSPLDDSAKSRFAGKHQLLRTAFELRCCRQILSYVLRTDFELRLSATPGPVAAAFHTTGPE